MRIKNEHQSTIVIYGNTLEAWLMAAGLGRSLFPALQSGSLVLTIVEPANINRAGRGVIGQPSDRQFYRFLGLKEPELLNACDGQFSLGFQYLNEVEARQARLSCFGECGFSLPGVAFHHMWLKLKSGGAGVAYEDFSIAANMAKNNKFCHPQARSKSLLAGLEYGVNLDQRGLISLLKSVARKSGVNCVEGDVVSREQVGERGETVSIGLKDDTRIIANLLIDAGVYGKPTSPLVSGAPSSCRVFSATKHNLNSVAPSTTTLEKWGRGIVRAAVLPKSIYYTYIESECEVMTNGIIGELVEKWGLEGEESVSLNVVRRQSVVEKWVGAELSVPHSESCLNEFVISPVSLVYEQLKVFRELIPTEIDAEHCAREYNARVLPIFQSLNEVQELHLLPVSGGQEVSESLRHRLALFCQRGRLPEVSENVLSEKQWISVLLGLGYEPKAYDPILERHNFSRISSQMRAGLERMAPTIESLPSLSEYRKKYLSSVQD